jgi:hypothetical protein
MKPIWAILSTTLCTATLAAGLIAGFYFMAGLERQPASELTAAPEPRPPVGRDIEHSALSTAATPSVEPFRPSLEAPSAAAANRYAVTADGDRHAPPPERWTPIKFEHEVPNALVGWLKEILGTDYPIVYTEAHCCPVNTRTDSIG